MEKKEIMEKIQSLYRECFIFYLATVNEEGIPEIKAIENIRFPENYPELKDKFKGMEKSLDAYFSTFKSSEKCKDLKRTGKATIYFHKQPQWFGVTLFCDVVFLDDPENKKKFWAKKFECFWKGVEDPEYKLIKLIPTKIKGWTGQHQFHYDL